MNLISSWADRQNGAEHFNPPQPVHPKINLLLLQDVAQMSLYSHFIKNQTQTFCDSRAATQDASVEGLSVFPEYIC